MRKGTNPNRGKQADRFLPVVLTAVTHLPDLKGYHAQRLEVVQTCLSTMRDNAGMETTVIIWDNGSCDELTGWLKNEYKPDVLIQSINIGKTAAKLRLARMLDDDMVMAFSDDDILFYPDWLKPQIELLDTFPNVAAVSGYPVRTQFRWGVKNTHEWGAKYGKMQSGRFIPEEWEKDFCTSIEREYKWHREYTLTDLDYIVEYAGLKAYATAHHCQCIGRAGTIAKAIRLDHAAMGDEKKFDIEMDNLGLRLTTLDRLTRHMGNIIDGELRVEVEKSKR